MQSRYITLNFFDLNEFVRECQRLDIKFVYLAKISKRTSVEYSDGVLIPHQEFWVLLTAFSYSEGIVLKLKGAYSRVSILGARNWRDEDKDPDRLLWHDAHQKAFETHLKWETALRAKEFYVGYGFLSLEDMPEAVAHEKTKDETPLPSVDAEGHDEGGH